MSKTCNQEVVKSLLDGLRNYINDQVDKLIKYIRECEDGQYLLSDELLSIFCIIFLYLERAKVYAAGLKFWYENYQNTANFLKHMKDMCTVDQWFAFCMYELNTSSLGIYYCLV